MDEIWIKHPSGIMVSNLGRVEMKTNKVITSGCVHEGEMFCYWEGVYCVIGELVLEAFGSKPDGALWVRHNDGNQLNNRLDNLSWV